MVTESNTHIYFSPHLDDVVMSCGGTIYEQVRAGKKVTVVSFFAGSPDDDGLTPYTLELKERWGGAQDPVAVRRQEDLAALKVLGATGVHLGFLDCVYRYAEANDDSPQRLVYYPTVEHIFGPVHPAEAEWHHNLEAAFLAYMRQIGFASLDAATLYAPLAAGHHVDHVLIGRLAFARLAQGQEVLFYEDYPYAGNSRTVGEALAAHDGCSWSAHTSFFGEEALQAKGEAVGCYASQISTFWPNAEAMHQALRAQALVVGQGRYGENYWKVS